MKKTTKELLSEIDALLKEHVETAKRIVALAAKHEADKIQQAQLENYNRLKGRI